MSEKESQVILITEIEAEPALVNTNRKLIAKMEMKNQGALAGVWGEEEPDAPEA